MTAGAGDERGSGGTLMLLEPTSPGYAVILALLLIGFWVFAR